MDTRFKYIELFAGVLGFGTAIDRLGGENVFMSEIDEYAVKVIKELKPNCNLHGDITKVDVKDVPSHDLLVAGFPCQAFSQNGKRLGFEDTRGTLFYDVARIMLEKKPKVALLENVKGLVNHDKGRTLETILNSLNDIGYIVDFTMLNSKFFNVPQNRDRIYIVAVREDLVKFEKWANLKGNYTMLPTAKRRLQKKGVKSFNFNFPKEESVNKILSDILESGVDKKYYVKEKDMKKIIHSEMPEFSDGLWIKEATTSGYSVANVGDSVNISYMESKTRRGRVGKQIANTIEAIICNQCVVEEDNKLRKLTPKEYWRLQSFPDESYEKASKVVSRKQLYKQAGNAVTVNVIEEICKNLLEYIY